MAIFDLSQLLEEMVISARRNALGGCQASMVSALFNDTVREPTMVPTLNG